MASGIPMNNGEIIQATIAVFPGKVTTFSLAKGSTVQELINLAEGDGMNFSGLTIKKTGGDIVQRTDTVIDGLSYTGITNIKGA